MTTTVGVDIGGTKILAVAFDEGDPSRILAEIRVPTPASEETLLDVISDVVHRVGGSRVSALGIGIAGLVDRAGVLRTSPNIPALRGVDLVTALHHRLDGMPVQVENDGLCAAWAEYTVGAACATPDALCLTIGTGIGAGLISDGRPYRGAQGFGGEVGHMVVERMGQPCPCGRRGCWEQYASGPGFARLGRQAAIAGCLERALSLAGGHVDHLTGEHVSQVALEGDEQALEVMRVYARWLALGIGNLIAILDCTLVVMAGGMVDLGDLLLDPVRDALWSEVIAPDERPDLRIVHAHLGERAGAIGAGLLGARYVESAPIGEG